VEMSPYDLNRGRIVYRQKAKSAGQPDEPML
jgi:translation initiation factor IF-1